ncbi:hypothetical protein P3X46_014300 [Hevea brasiliensis]|uniref:Rx N-terminal domain-containing protein n=1 Tax=Hevea brasiliensis TaxID=3981 RepID=A0ABQ9M691_HEVBR|nr:hypothetical protein P3X46_014300 [Hevea brasiliensis]
MQCLLKDADHQQDQDERVRNWVAEIKDLTYDAEDIIDNFLLKAARGGGEGFHGFINRASFMFTKAFHLHEVETQIRSVQAKIGDMPTSMQTYGIKFVAEGEGYSSASEMQQRLRRSYPYDDDDEQVISLDANMRDLKDQLMMEEKQVLIVSIEGMGGLGTLAKKVCNDSHVKQHFYSYSWAFLSQ